MKWTINGTERRVSLGERLLLGDYDETDAVTTLLLREYGSVLVAGGGALTPPTLVFHDDREVTAFQNLAVGVTVTIGTLPMTLQGPAMNALGLAIADASKQGLTITPRGPDAAARSYDDAVSLWASRVEPALDHWVGHGRLTLADAERIRSLSPFGQVDEVLRLERQGIFFAKDLQKSIIYSVAPPGTSQHLSMLAFDAAEFDDPDVREILARRGWFQTVVSDLPHFTFLGVDESVLGELGLKRIDSGGRSFWVPDI